MDWFSATYIQLFEIQTITIFFNFANKKVFFFSQNNIDFCKDEKRILRKYLKKWRTKN